VSGRWPTNLVFTHAVPCTSERCVEGCPVKELDDQSGDLPSNKSFSQTNERSPRDAPILYATTKRNSPDHYGDQGGASRFYPCFFWQLADFEGLP